MSEPSGSRVVKLQDCETVKFIELYGSERVLYDSNCKDYKDKDLRLAAAMRISESMGISGFGPKEVIAKFKNLRSSYCQELKKIAESGRSGSGTDDIYVPKVLWFENMNAFIRPFVTQRSTKPIVTQMVIKRERSSDSEPAQKPETDEESQTNGDEDVSHDRWSTSLPNDHLQVDLEEEHPLKRRRRLRMNSMNDGVERSDSGLLYPRKDDIYDHFGRYMASMLRELGPPESLSLQQQITSLVLGRVMALSDKTAE